MKWKAKFRYRFTGTTTHPRKILHLLFLETWECCLSLCWKQIISPCCMQGTTHMLSIFVYDPPFLLPLICNASDVTESLTALFSISHPILSCQNVSLAPLTSVYFGAEIFPGRCGLLTNLVSIFRLHSSDGSSQEQGKGRRHNFSTLKNC